MQCPKCNFVQPDEYTECAKCGIVFNKYRPPNTAPPPSNVTEAAIEENAAGIGEWIRNLVFFVKPQINPLIFAGRVLFFLVIFIWGLKLIFTPLQTNYSGESFWHLVNLPFHEAGHIFFRPFGRFMTSLGGSLAQLLMPLICLAVFLIKTRDTFAAAFSLWWFGENFIDLAPYINDARARTLPLLGGNTGRTSPYGFHDWEYILKESGLIRYDHILASLSHKLGALVMICAYIWGGYILFKQYKNLQSFD
jgi:hypothetical protein